MTAKILNLAPKLNDVWLSHDVNIVTDLVFRKLEKEIYTVASNTVIDGSSLIEVRLTDDGEVEVEILRLQDTIKD